MAAPSQFPFGEHRAGPVYSVEAELAYRLVRNGKVLPGGAGRAVSVSSTTILLQAMPVPPPDMEIELDIAWPSRSDGRVTLQLHVAGRTLPLDGGRTAVQILVWKLRPRGTSNLLR